MKQLVRVRLPAARLTQVLLNLILNAGSAMKKEGRVMVRARALDGERVRIEVDDSGPGVPVEMRDRTAGVASNRNFKLIYHYLRLFVVLISSASIRGRHTREAS